MMREANAYFCICCDDKKKIMHPFAEQETWQASILPLGTT
jgi:hypothetical protein